MPPTANTESTPLPPSATAAGAEATNNALNAARAALQASTATETNVQAPAASGITPEGSGQSIGAVTLPGQSHESIGTGLLPKEDEPLIPAATAFTENAANIPVNVMPTETPAAPEAQTVDAPVSPLDNQPPTVKSPEPQPSVTVMGPGDNISLPNSNSPVESYTMPPKNPEPVTAAEVLAATPEPTTDQTFPNRNPESVKDFYDLDQAYSELKSAKTPEEKFKALAAIQTLATIDAINEHDKSAA